MSAILDMISTCLDRTYRYSVWFGTLLSLGSRSLTSFVPTSRFGMVVYVTILFA
jgi:hypothetical protein